MRSLNRLLAGLCALVTLMTAGCQTARTFATPDVSWKSHVGQLKHTNSKRTLVGEVVVQQRGTQEFQLDFLKGGSFPLISLRQDATIARAEGLLANGHWQGVPSQAPRPLRPWLGLREVFSQRYSATAGGSMATSDSLTFSEDGQRFEFLFNR